MMSKIQGVRNVLLGLALILVAGCAQPDRIVEQSTPTHSTTGPQQPPKQGLAPSTASPITRAQPAEPGDPTEVKLPPFQIKSEDPYTFQARSDLAKRLGLPVDQVQVVSVLHTEFSMQAFFCQIAKERIQRDAPPEMIEGQLILLVVSGKKYEYHVNESNLVFCSRQDKFRP